jgi:hypothetical protein
LCRYGRTAVSPCADDRISAGHGSPGCTRLAASQLKLVFGLKLPKVSLELFNHRVSLNSGYVTGILEFDNLSEIASSLFPSQTVCKKQQSGIGPFSSNDSADISKDIGHLGSSCAVTLRLYQDASCGLRWYGEVAFRVLTSRTLEGASHLKVLPEYAPDDSLGEVFHVASPALS